MHLQDGVQGGATDNSPGVGVLADQFLQGREGRGDLRHRQAGRQLAAVHVGYHHHAHV